MPDLVRIFFDVMAPVFSLVLLGYVAGPRLGLEARTLSRVAFTLFVPAFVFTTLANAAVQADTALRMVSFIVVVELACGLVAFGLARALRRPAQMVAAYILIATFGNVGNFGFPIIQFALGPEALGAATIYFLAILIVSFMIGVAAANWERGGSMGAFLAVLRTPALLALPPAVLVNVLDLSLPLALSRPIDLLGSAMIPTMLLTLGVQLASARIPRPDLDMLLASAIRLLVGPALAFALAAPFGVAGIERAVGILQASMPTAVLASIIATENDLLPAFVTATVLFSTLLSVLTLTTIIALL